MVVAVSVVVVVVVVVVPGGRRGGPMVVVPWWWLGGGGPWRWSAVVVSWWWFRVASGPHVSSKCGVRRHAQTWRQFVASGGQGLDGTCRQASGEIYTPVAPVLNKYQEAYDKRANFIFSNHCNKKNPIFFYLGCKSI